MCSTSVLLHLLVGNLEVLPSTTESRPGSWVNMYLEKRGVLILVYVMILCHVQIDTKHFHVTVNCLCFDQSVSNRRYIQHYVRIDSSTKQVSDNLLMSVPEGLFFFKILY
jgi:hypothetical protein